jgi:hypothetical protein
VAINKFGEARCSAEAIVEEAAKPAPPTPAKPDERAIVKPLQDIVVMEGKGTVLSAVVRGKGARGEWDTRGMD